MSGKFVLIITFTAVLMVTLGLTFNVAFMNVEALELRTNMPVVYVDPQDISATTGETFTISVKIFNLTNNYYTTNQKWDPGENLGPYSPNGEYNYSLGNLLGLDIKFSWDPALLGYVNHTVNIPIEEHPGGILHEPVFTLKDDVEASNGTYWLAIVSLSEAFNTPDSSATMFTMTFRVIKQEPCVLSLDAVDLATSWVTGDPHLTVIPSWIENGQFQLNQSEPFPTWIVTVIAIIVVIAGIAVALVYFAKIKKTTQKD